MNQKQTNHTVENVKTVTTLKLTLPIYYEISYKTKKNKKVLIGLNWYRNVHYMLNNKVKHHYHELVAGQVSNTVIKTPCKVKFGVYMARKGTDGHNVRSICEKYILDALVASNVIGDDSLEYIQKTSSEFFIDKKTPRIEVELISI